MIIRIISRVGESHKFIKVQYEVYFLKFRALLKKFRKTFGLIQKGLLNLDFIPKGQTFQKADSQIQKCIPPPHDFIALFWVKKIVRNLLKSL